MRIGSDNNFLSVERVEQEAPAITWRIAAAIGSPGWWAAAMHERVKLDSTPEAAARGADFAAGATQRLELRLQEGGCLRIERRPDGGILVRYRLGPVAGATALEGEVGMECELAEAFYRQLAELVRPR